MTLYHCSQCKNQETEITKESPFSPWALGRIYTKDLQCVYRLSNNALKNTPDKKNFQDYVHGTSGVYTCYMNGDVLKKSADENPLRDKHVCPNSKMTAKRQIATADKVDQFK